MRYNFQENGFKHFRFAEAEKSNWTNWIAVAVPKKKKQLALIKMTGSLLGNKKQLSQF